MGKTELSGANYFKQLVICCNTKSLPPRAPYSKISESTLGEKVDKKNAVAAHALPAMATARHPNLFARAPATGPEIIYLYVDSKLTSL